MAVENTLSYHCSFLLDPQGGGLRLALAWRRVGNCDYGVYISCDPQPTRVLFMATHSPRGEMSEFFVLDGALRCGKRWDEDHLNFESDPPVIGEREAALVSELSDAFCDEWFESYGATITTKFLSKICEGAAAERPRGLEALIASELPIQVQPEKMPDILASAELTERNFLYAFLPHSHGAAGDHARAALESKMRLFFELI